MLTSKPRLPVREIIFTGLLPSPLKKLLYRLIGYKIGRNVSLGLGCVISGKHVEIGDGTQIGFLTMIRGRSVKIAPHVQIGSMSFIDVPQVEIGEGSRINEQVYVGGLQFPDSKFVMGRNCQIMQMSFLNPTRSITIGDDTGIGGHCLLFGHTSWLSVFEGYPVEFDTIEIGSSVSVSWRVFILPGAKIGDGTIIGANSLVRGTIPANCLAVGFPARVVSKSPELPRIMTEADKVQILRKIVLEMVDYFRGSELECRGDESSLTIVRRARNWWKSDETWMMRTAYTPSDLANSHTSKEHLDLLISLHKIPSEIRRALDDRACVWIDIDSKARSDRHNEIGEEVSLYLRRYGVRLLREACE